MKLTHELLEINAVAMVECIVPPEHSKDSGSKAAYKMGHAHGQKKSKMVDAGKVFGVNAGAYKAGHAAGSSHVTEDKGDLDDYVSDKPATKSKTKEGWFVVDKRTKLDIHAGPFSDRQEARDEADDYDGAVVQYGHALPNGDFEKLPAPVDEAVEPYKAGTKVKVDGKLGEISYVKVSNDPDFPHNYKITDLEADDPHKQKRLENGNFIPHNRIKVVKESNGIYEPVTDAQVSADNGPLGRRGGQLKKNKNGTLRVVTDGNKTLKQAVKESEEDDEDEEQDKNTFFVAFYESDEKHSWIGKVSKEGGGKWHESSYKGTADDRWGQHYMSYLSPEDIMGWIKKDYGRHIEIEGPFFDVSEAEAYVKQNWGKIKESTVSESLRLVKTHKGADGSCAKVYKDNEWNEYRVKFYDKEGKHKEAADHHTDDLDDANGTAELEMKKASKTNESVFTNYADWKQAVLLSHPAQAKSIKFRGKMEGEKTTVSAVIPGEDKVFGIWDDAITSGTVLSEVKKFEKGESDLDAAFNYLNELIKSGTEYPDAEHKAATKFNVSQKQLRKAYDEQK